MPNIGTYRGIAIYYQEDRDRYRMWYTDNKGKKKPVYGKTKELVKTNYDKIQEELRKGLYIANMPDTLLKLMNQMLDEQEEDKNLKQNSINRKRDTANIVREHIKCCRKQIKRIKECPIKLFVAHIDMMYMMRKEICRIENIASRISIRYAHFGTFIIVNKSRLAHLQQETGHFFFCLRD